MTKKPTINRRGWLAMWLQKRRRARQNKSLPAPSLVSLGTVAGDTTWQAVAPVVVNDWQFCTTDSAFDPAVKSFDQWVADADFPDTEFVIINAATTTVTADFTYCAARYLVGTTWSSWTGVVDKTVIEPPVQLVLTSDGHGRLSWSSNVFSPYEYAIGYSSDGVTFNDEYDGSTNGNMTRDLSGLAGYYRVSRTDDEGNVVFPHSNMVYSDGL